MSESVPDSFHEIYELYKEKVFNTALSYLQNNEDAEDVTQEIFVEIHHSLSRFSGNSSIGTWIYRIAVNKSLDHLRSRNRKKRFAFIIDLFDPKSGEPRFHPTDFEHPGVKLENKERSTLLFKAIDQLSENQKTAFILSRIEGLSNIKIAGIMQMKVGAVESLQSRAKETLKKNLIKSDITAKES